MLQKALSGERELVKKYILVLVGNSMDIVVFYFNIVFRRSVIFMSTFNFQNPENQTKNTQPSKMELNQILHDFATSLFTPECSFNIAMVKCKKNTSLRLRLGKNAFTALFCKLNVAIRMHLY